MSLASKGGLLTIITNVNKLRKERMHPQQLLDHIIVPTLKYMGGNYDSKNARMLLLATAAIESKCGYYIKQIGGPALGIWQMEPNTEGDIWKNCDALGVTGFHDLICNLVVDNGTPHSKSKWTDGDLIYSPVYACAMARLKYSMDSAPLPDHNDIEAVYREYKRIYNTPLGSSTYEKFLSAMANNHIMDVVL